MPGMDADRIRVMRRGVMPGIPQGPQAVIHDGHRDQAFQLITTSGLLWSKGHDRILETASELRRRGIAFRWILTGDGPNHEWLNFELHRRQLEDVVIPPRRRWTAKAIHRALAESDLYVQLPRSEYMGYCMMDAAAVGLPCLSTETGMIREVFTHGETALLIDPFRAAALADRIISLMQDIDLRKQLAKKSREMICRTYTVDNYIDGYRKLCTT
jgi:colanic acid/amylovoran biosynthesis glycosyltransferase